MTGSITVVAAQREVRSVFLSGSVGQAVSGTLWLVSAAATTWSSVRAGIMILVVGGFFIFPMTQLALRILGRPAALASGNPLNGLAMQVAFIVPLLLPLAGAAALYELSWFYPAVMMIVGAHYLPFMFLYGMRSFGVLAVGLLGAGALLAFQPPVQPSIGAWLTGSGLIAFSGWCQHAWTHEFRAPLSARS